MILTLEPLIITRQQKMLVRLWYCKLLRQSRAISFGYSFLSSGAFQAQNQAWICRLLHLATLKSTGRESSYTSHKNCQVNHYHLHAPSHPWSHQKWINWHKSDWRFHIQVLEISPPEFCPRLNQLWMAWGSPGLMSYHSFCATSWDRYCLCRMSVFVRKHDENQKMSACTPHLLIGCSPNKQSQ